MKTFNLFLNFDDTCLAWLHGDSVAIEMSNLFTFCIKNFGEERKRTGLGILILYLRFCVNHCFMVGDVKIGGIDIGTCRTEIGIKWQGLIEFVCDMQIHILRDTTIVGIEVTVVPLIAAVMLARAILPTVITADCNHVLTFYNIRCQVEATCHNTILAKSEMMTIEIEISSLAYAFELDEEFRGER